MLLNRHGMAHSTDQGKNGAGPTGWEDLCDNLKGLILELLSLRDLVRAARVCREFRAAFSSRVSEERAALIASAEEAYGKPLFPTFVTALRCALAGARPFPQLVDAGPLDGFFLPDEQEPKWELRFASRQDIQQRNSAPEPFAVISGDGIGPVYMNGLLFSALYRGCLGVTPNPMSWAISEVHTLEERPIWSEVSVDLEEAGLALGILLAVWRETPEAPLSSTRRPLFLNIVIKGGDRVVPLGAPAHQWFRLLTVTWR